MSWKIDETTKSILLDDSGNPVWINAAGEEKGFDAEKVLTSLSKANEEAAGRRKKLGEYEERYKPLAEIEDLPSWYAEASKALETVKGLPEQSKAVEERIRAQVEASTKPLNEKLTESEKRYAELKEQYQRAEIGNAFARSNFVREKLVSAALASDLMSKHFYLSDDGKIVAKDQQGAMIYGSGGEASFDEALAILIEQSPHKPHLLKGSPASGSGAGSQNGSVGGKVISRSAFDVLPPHVKAEKMKEGYTLTDN